MAHDDELTRPPNNMETMTIENLSFWLALTAVTGAWLV
jgi:hypothetical protein